MAERISQENVYSEENVQEIMNKIQTLKEWTTSENLIPELPEKTLKLFLHSCIYNIEDTKSTLVSYYKLRVQSPEYFSNRNPNAEYLITASTIGYSIMLPGTTDEGYKTIMIGYFHSDTSNYVFNDLIQRFMMTVDMWLSKLDIYPGYLILVECKHSTFGHYSSASFESMKKLCSYFQEALPIRLKGILFVNIAQAINMLLTIVNPLLSKKLNNLIHRYARGNEDYLKLIPRRILPSDLGGESLTIQEMHDATQQELVDYYDWFKNEDQIIKSLVAKNPDVKKSNFFETIF